jgi:hypothetical protein
LTLYETQQENFHIVSSNNSGHRAIADGKARDKNSTGALHRSKSHIQTSGKVTMFNIDMIYIFNHSSVDTRWQQYITHLHTNSTHVNEKGKLGSAGRATSVRVIPSQLANN